MNRLPLVMTFLRRPFRLVRTSTRLPLVRPVSISRRFDRLIFAGHP